MHRVSSTRESLFQEQESKCVGVLFLSDGTMEQEKDQCIETFVHSDEVIEMKKESQLSFLNP